MTLEGEYEPSVWDWVREQIDTYERSGGREANTFADTGLPIIVVTTRGNKTGKVRKTAADARRARRRVRAGRVDGRRARRTPSGTTT